MAGAFQSNAFQNDAFQVNGAAPPPPPPAPAAPSASGPGRVGEEPRRRRRDLPPVRLRQFSDEIAAHNRRIEEESAHIVNIQRAIEQANEDKATHRARLDALEQKAKRRHSKAAIERLHAALGEIERVISDAKAEHDRAQAALVAARTALIENAAHQRALIEADDETALEFILRII